MIRREKNFSKENFNFLKHINNDKLSCQIKAKKHTQNLPKTKIFKKKIVENRRNEMEEKKRKEFSTFVVRNATFYKSNTILL